METGTEIEVEVEVENKKSMKSTWLERLYQKRKAMKQLVGWVTFFITRGNARKGRTSHHSERGVVRASPSMRFGCENSFSSFSFLFSSTLPLCSFCHFLILLQILQAMAFKRTDAYFIATIMVGICGLFVGLLSLLLSDKKRGRILYILSFWFNCLC